MMSEDLKEYLDQRGRMGKLDSLLLYLTSLFGLLFSLIQALGFGIEGVIRLIPLLFSGMFLPIYFGYVRGALMTDSLEERIRGWLYLICGIPFYLVPPNITNNIKIAPNMVSQKHFYGIYYQGTHIAGFSSFLSLCGISSWFNRINIYRQDL